MRHTVGCSPIIHLTLEFISDFKHTKQASHDATKIGAILEQIDAVNEAVKDIKIQHVEGDMVTADDDLPEEGVLANIVKVNEENVEMISVELEEGDIEISDDDVDDVIEEKTNQEKRNAVRNKNELWFTRDLAYTIADGKFLFGILSHSFFCKLML